MTAKEILEKARDTEYLCMQKRKQYEKWQNLIEVYKGYEMVIHTLSGFLEEIEKQICELMKSRYAADDLIMNLSDEDAIHILSTYYIGNVPLDFIADDYPDGGLEYVQEVFDKALKELETLDKKEISNNSV